MWHIEELAQALEAIGFIQEIRTDPSQPYRFVWPEDQLETLPVAPDAEGMVGIDFVKLDVAAIDPDLVEALRVEFRNRR